MCSYFFDGIDDELLESRDLVSVNPLILTALRTMPRNNTMSERQRFLCARLSPRRFTCIHAFSILTVSPGGVLSVPFIDEEMFDE